MSSTTDTEGGAESYEYPKPGDRVRITYEGIVTSTGRSVRTPDEEAVLSFLPTRSQLGRGARIEILEPAREPGLYVFRIGATTATVRRWTGTEWHLLDGEPTQFDPVASCSGLTLIGRVQEADESISDE